MYEKLKAMVKDFPETSGVYLMKDAKSRIIYIGKAKNLRKRVSSYFLGGRDLKTRFLDGNIESIEYIVTRNVYEALILENNLIKKWNHRYNIMLKDGKSYPVIRITREDYPKVFKTRRIIRDGSEYFGPFADVVQLDRYIELIEKMFPLRRCGTPLKKRYEPCLYFHIGRCKAPCIGNISIEEYAVFIQDIKKLLAGDIEVLRKQLKGEMAAAAAALHYEKAAEVRDTISALESVVVKQQVEDFNPEKRDYAACVMYQHVCTIAMFQMRDGKLIGRELYRSETFGNETEALLDFLLQYYLEAEELPEILYVSHDIDIDLIRTYFSKELSREISIQRPVDGKHYRILRMAAENAERDAARRLKHKENIPGLEELQKQLALQDLPRRIEGFDIAQLSGKYPVASLVSFFQGVPDKKQYRRFHLKTLGGKIDDYESMKEAVTRRYTRLVQEGSELPDLIVIDGGKGQVNVARGVLDALGLTEIPVIGLAKEFEEIHFPGESAGPLRLPENSEGLKVLQAVRDETHRFATTENQRLRGKDSIFSLIESVPGIGPQRSKRIMKTYGSLEMVAASSAVDIAKKCGIPYKSAQALLAVINL